ncbi:MAG: hypothetical protein A3C50_01630 [Candidatus Staskawiczbacteria bacterium RIFCSPHIGHO2_02_FULL_43_16]|uniref:Uncharacterized protein n=1 Tax=Candidatus Staskawiczbacteria bacterium RIFCSPHIGHO2_01_FULL_41_41 TaxID=1802203 RepID=A0A1G2HUH0_9BACT|nr:MAG: hypothetical protein A2822_04045 [Candidatus Staskawiczbacteria bacterium RIFCSPHIGHO2_01_FULL_41_41]OGZ69081.1 MAG: hypothetical protein A3C50_01630 [Candidatus Staskawiczbacteria bacterium RIFCSPHIGHO2_02_FULL_43_16]OGZ74492.1 MAG: hypothetical protein A3A12_01860 [Candidatus Staskawiczbacteria bacterium RIFCSPLOWO2_01_FULL_43_17b]
MILVSKDSAKLLDTEKKMRLDYPGIATNMVKECQLCKDIVSMEELANLENPNRCPNCHQTW